MPRAGAETRFGDAGRVGIVEDVQCRPVARADHRGRVRADPRLVDVRGGADGAADDDGGQRASDRAGSPSLLDERRDVRADRIGGRGLRRLEPDPARRGARGEVDVRGFDARAADVDADECACASARLTLSSAGVSAGRGLRRFASTGRPRVSRTMRCSATVAPPRSSRATGSIDWWCVPRFDSGACFAALARHARPRPVPDHAGRRRAVESPLPRGHDGARDRARHADRPRARHRLSGDRSAIGRCSCAWSRASSGEVDMRVELVVRFDYGIDRAVGATGRRRVARDRRARRPRAAHAGATARRGLKTVEPSSRSARRAGAVRARLVPVARSAAGRHDAAALVARTTKHWRNWSARCRYTGRVARAR